MSLLDLLHSFINPTQNFTGSGDQSSAAQAVPTADELAVTAAPHARSPSAQGVTPGDQTLMDSVPTNPTFNQSVDQSPDSPTMNYSNRGTLDAVQAANRANAPDRGANGLYGILPSGMQHGTLRNILGHIGDAMLVTSGMQPTYEPYLERQAEGNAMAGVNFDDPASVQAAVSRLAATGAPGALEAADRLQQQSAQAGLKKAYQENTNAYRQGVLGDREQYHQQETAARNSTLYQRMYPAAVADLASATNDDDYRAKLSAWNQRIKAVDPNEDAMSAFGAPLNYTPGFFTNQSGMSNTQLGQQANVRRGQDMQQQNSQGRDQAILGSAATHAGAIRYSADRSANRSTQMTQDQQYMDMKKAGIPTTPEQDQNFQSHNQISSRNRRPTPSNSAPRPITAQDVLFLRAHPEQTDAFNTRFHQYGANVAQRILRQAPGRVQ